MEHQYLLGIDVGTSSIKVALVNVNGVLVNIERKEYSVISPQEGWAELPIDTLWNHFLQCLEKLIAKSQIDAKDIKAIGVSCLCPGLMPLGEKGEALLNPIIFMDKRSVNEVEIIKGKISEEELFKISGNKLMAGACSLTSMLWIKRNKPEIYKKTKFFGHLNTYFVHKLTGNFGIDYTNASYTGLFETSGGYKWARDIAEIIGIDAEKLPPVIPSDAAAGSLNSSQLIDLGLLQGIPVAMGGADTACSALAVGVVEHNQVFESVGTTNVITICSERPVFDIRFINRCHVVKDRWLYHGALSSTGASLKWFRDEFCQDLVKKEEETGVNAYQAMDELAQHASPGANGLIFLPYMAGERSPVWDPDAKGVFYGLSLQTKKNDMIRAILEGCGFGLRQLIEMAEGITGEKIDAFVAIGGGAKSKVWGQIKADITGKIIRILDINDAAVIGATLLAGIAAGIYIDAGDAEKKVNKRMHMQFCPQLNNKTLYQAKFKIYEALYPRLKDLFKQPQGM